jgi:hypothetical protein
MAGMEGIRSMGSDPNSGFNRAKNYWTGALQGGPNDALYRNVESKVMPSVASMFSNAGRYGSGLHADTATRALTEAYSPYAQQQMNAAAGALPQLEGANAQSLLGIGGMPQEALNQYLTGITGAGNYAATTSKTPYYQPSPFTSLLGAGLGAAGSIMGGPLGGSMFGGGMTGAQSLANSMTMGR